MPNELCEQLLFLSSQENAQFWDIIIILFALAVAELGLVMYFYYECT
jgi:hypothetical protein